MTNGETTIIGNHIANILNKITTIKQQVVINQELRPAELKTSLEFDCQVLDILMDKFSVQGKHYPDEIQALKNEKMEVISMLNSIN